MFRQMMKRKHVHEERELRKMADQVADELARGVRLGGEEPANPKRRRTIPLHDPFFVGTPEEEQRHSQRLLASTRKRKSDDYADLDDAVGGAQAAAELMAAGQRLSKGPRRSKAQASVVDIDTLNRKLSSFALTDEDQCAPLSRRHAPLAR